MAVRLGAGGAASASCVAARSAVSDVRSAAISSSRLSDVVTSLIISQPRASTTTQPKGELKPRRLQPASSGPPRHFLSGIDSYSPTATKGRKTERCWPRRSRPASRTASIQTHI